MTDVCLSSRPLVDRLEHDHPDRLLQEVRDLPAVLDVVVRRSVRLEGSLVPVALEEMERSTGVPFLVEVVSLAPRLRPRPFDHPRQQRAKIRCSPFSGTERSEDGHRAVGHAHLTTGSSDPAPGAVAARSERAGAVYRASARVERR
jgi:hypothetical protein